MKTTARSVERTSVVKTCLATCRKALARVKEAIFDESRQMLRANEQLLRLTLNEAEALAWQTAYPHLVFPTLATEKVQAVARWEKRQRSLQMEHSTNSAF
jgi:hypothetical protein